MADEIVGVAAFSEGGRTVTRAVMANGKPGAEVRWDLDADDFVDVETGEPVGIEVEPAVISPEEWARGFELKAARIDALADELEDEGRTRAAEQARAKADDLRASGGEAP